jgi:AbrB family looped-hinge helix DNA binding protein
MLERANFTRRNIKVSGARHAETIVMRRGSLGGILHRMKTKISSKGRIVVPADIRRRDGIQPGDEFEIERLDRGKYQLRRAGKRRNEGLIQLLLACPVKGWFPPLDRRQTTDDLNEASKWPSR